MRTIIKPLILLVASLFCTTAILADTTTTTSKPDPSYLYIQYAKGSSLKPVANKPGWFTLTVSQATPYVSYFTDHPARETGMLSTSDFVKNWKANKTMRHNPPNVAIVAIDKATQSHVNYVAVLRQPVFNAKNDTVTYAAHITSKMPKDSDNNYDFTVLFFDGFNWNGNM